MSKTFLTMLWEPQGGWREGAGYDVSIVAGVDYMLRQAVPDVRHVCICDEVYRIPLIERGIDWFPLWDIHGLPRTTSHGFDCYARLGLWGLPGMELAEYLGDDVAQWTDLDVMIKPTAGVALTHRWRDMPNVYWVPRSHQNMLEKIYAFGKNQHTWLGVNGSACRLQLGSRPDWWAKVADAEYRAETEAHICGSDQALMTRLILEEQGSPWREPNEALFAIPRFGPDMQAHGMWGDRWEVAYFPYDLGGNFTKPWLSDNAYLRREYRVLSGQATDAEMRAECHPGLRRYMGKT